MPLIVYWQFDYLNTCTLNPQIPINNFTSSVLSYANTKGVKQKLNGRTVELSVTEIPNIFSIDDKGHMIWIIYAFSWDKIVIKPVNKNLTVSYRILQDNNEIKKGVITVSSGDREVPLGMFQSLKNKTLGYLSQYDAGIKGLGKTVVDKLIEEL